MSKKLKIIFVTNNYTPYSGGVVSSIIAYAQALRGLGHTVHIVTLDFDGRYEADPFVVRLSSSLTFKYKNNPMAVPAHAVKELGAIFDKIKPDVVHSQHPFLLGTYAQRLCAERTIPIVFTHHTQYDQYAHYVPFPQRLTRRMINHHVVRYCESVQAAIAPSRAIATELAVRGVRVSVYVLASPILPIFQAMFECKRELINDQCARLLSVGRFTPEKNITFLLDVLAGLADQRFRLSLVGYGFYQPDLERYAFERLNLSREQLSFVVRPTREALRDLYHASDIFVFASQSETQGIVLAEAMACGLPVVALNGPGVDDIVVDGVNGFLIDNNMQMKQALEHITQDAALFELLCKGAIKTSEQYRAETLAQRLVEIYRSVVR